MVARSRSLLIAVLSLTAGCATPASSHTSKPPRRLDRTVLTREQMVSGRFATVYDAVAALRSMWLRPRGPESFTLPTEVWVYLDNARLGRVEVLRNIQPNLITTVRFYDGPSATGRWGVGHGSGVIHVSTWANGALGFPGTVDVVSDSAQRDSARTDSVRTDSVRADSARADSARRGRARRPGKPDSINLDELLHGAADGPA